MDIHDRIKELRLKRGMSQTDLANRLGYKDKSSISKIEKGNGDLTQTQITMFADALRTSPIYLTDGVITQIDYEINMPDNERAILDAFRKFDDVDQARVSAYIEGIAEKYKIGR